MNKLLGIDLGSKLCGLAISDSLQTIAFRYKSISTQDLLSLLPKIIQDEQINTIIVGENLYQNKNFPIENLIRKLSKNLCLPVIKVNEDFSTDQAKEIYQQFPKKEQIGFNKVKDAISAQIILQRYIDQKW